MDTARSGGCRLRVKHSRFPISTACVDLGECDLLLEVPLSATPPPLWFPPLEPPFRGAPSDGEARAHHGPRCALRVTAFCSANASPDGSHPSSSRAYTRL